MRAGQKLNFHLCSRKFPTDDASIADDVLPKNTRHHDDEHCIDLLRQRFRDVFEEVHKELKTGELDIFGDNVETS